MLRLRHHARQHAHVVVEQHHIGTVARHVGAARHGNRYVGRGQHRRIVDAVAHHQYFSALPLQRFHISQLVFRRSFGLRCIQPQFGGQRFHRGGTVAAQHVQAQALLFQNGQHVAHAFFHFVGQQKGRLKTGLIAQIHEAAAVLDSFGFGRQFTGDFGHETGAPKRPNLRVAMNTHLRAHAVAYAVEPLRYLNIEAV